MTAASLRGGLDNKPEQRRTPVQGRSEKSPHLLPPLPSRSSRVDIIAGIPKNNFPALAKIHLSLL